MAKYVLFFEKRKGGIQKKWKWARTIQDRFLDATDDSGWKKGGRDVEQNWCRGGEKGRFLLVMEFLPRVGHCGGHVLMPQAAMPAGLCSPWPS